jgi:hypothetical protein
MCNAPLVASAQLPGSPITNDGVIRAGNTVDSVFVQRTAAIDTVDIGDFTGYLLARLGVPPFADSMGFRVTSDTNRARISGRLLDFPVEARSELGPIFFFVDSTALFVAEIGLRQRTGGLMRFRLERVTVAGFPIPQLLLIPALLEYSRRYPVLAADGWEFLVAMPVDGEVRFLRDGLELKTKR